MITNVAKSFAAAKKKYDRGNDALGDALALGGTCLKTLHENASLRRFGLFAGPPEIEYWVAESDGALSRPYRPDLFIQDPDELASEAQAFIEDMRRKTNGDPERFDRVIYTIVTAFCLCYDVWKPKSRKTPGTFFEVLIGSAARVRFPGLALTKHIPIKAIPVDDVVDEMVEMDPDTDEETVEALQGDSVSTDLVLADPDTDRGAVIPLKITTRERIVQPFAHQRILDSAYPGRFASFLACMSEVQRDDNSGTVKQICVPGTVALFQKHLARLSGLYYCDIPVRYARPDLGAVIDVKPLHRLFDDVEAHLDAQSAS